MNKIVIIFPCYNEEEVLIKTKNEIVEKFTKLVSKKIISSDSKICFVDDGSKDKTWEIIESFKEINIIGIKLARNVGHQFTLLAGLETLKNSFDAYITMDVDLQDDINSIEDMISEYTKGNDIVYGIREERITDTFFKRKTAELFYLFMMKLGVNIHYNHADYRIINNKVLLEFLKFNESHLFLRGIFPLIGFQQSKIYYKRKERVLGESKYPLKKMLSFAWEGITSFSDKPIKLVLNLGIFSILISLLLGFWALIQMLLGNTITGWTSIIVLIIFFGGIQTLSLGLIGEYIGKIYIQTKNRPRYGVEKLKNFLNE
ncbi:glycosyltransferase family 2 protein [Empedobacter sp. 225-1]|uniref:glycosyltransferase family 2 protein n=2 Tax=Empedobacter TaxID=59734 RepID=UPI002576E433|nr:MULTISPECIES: glycosyltransferase family 2 protein [unclassified Empedobacter]MDM1522354.1 glycosyltransferase family 2 protein [Empedobacter sp. 225-1]MDM1541851.1 glycosyltransferase family 2 protein [Empedobacter sp. 189-2]